jgi:hypothetical protein
VGRPLVPNEERVYYREQRRWVSRTSMPTSSRLIAMAAAIVADRATHAA